MKHNFKNPLLNKVILITGGTGSFGQKFVELVEKNYQPRAIRIFSRGEFAQYQMAQKFSEEQQKKLRFFIGDVRDKERVYRAMRGVDIVIHAAALKQIVLTEYNPVEAVKTNILGSINIINAAIDNNVSKVMFISTDKATNPINLYGATKLCAEKLFIQANSYTGYGKTKFSCVRYGNVLGSRGSVIPLFLKQRKQGKITITDKEMTRFWITLEEAVQFVINSVAQMRGGEIFIPKIPSVKITDIANAIAQNIKQIITGIRPGEKLHETLLSVEEARHTKEFDDFFLVEPEHTFWKKINFPNGKKIPEGFTYISNKNDQWITPEQIKKIIKNVTYEN